MGRPSYFVPMHRFYRNGLFCLLLLLTASGLKASHYLGGEIYYQRIGATSGGGIRYKVTLVYYQDCHHGNAQTINEDDPAFLSLYRRQTRIGTSTAPLDGAPQLVSTSNIACAGFREEQCIRAIRFVTFIEVSASSIPSIVTNQRCCMPAELVNLTSPGQQGITQFAEIPAGTLSDNSPVFRDPPPGFWCAGIPFSFNLAASDPDGDSLSYRLVSIPGGGTANDAKPNPSLLPNATLLYTTGYGPLNPLGAAGSVQLDPLTGRLTGTC